MVEFMVFDKPKTPMMQAWFRYRRAGAYIDWGHFIQGRLIAKHMVMEMELCE